MALSMLIYYFKLVSKNYQQILFYVFILRLYVKLINTNQHIQFIFLKYQVFFK